ncbi:MAG: aldehyde dehydrogenase family protein [Bradymonadaceae bacterium]
MSTTTDDDGRVPVYKTYKLYIDGNYPRTESGRYIQIDDHEGNFVANICHASRKDFRDAVVAAREALDGWFGRTAFNRGQILYRMGEMLEARKPGFVDHLVETLGVSRDAAEAEVEAAIDRLVWYAGWSDKFEQVFGSTNPVASNHFNFTTPEPTGVIAVFAPQNAPLLGLISAIAPVIVSGNTVVTIVDNDAPQVAIEFAEVLNNSDLPGGVINLLTGERDELIGHVGGHKDVDGIIAYGATDEHEEQLALEGAESVKRVKFKDDPADWTSDDCQSPYWILPFVEFKTNWHPVGV